METQTHEGAEELELTADQFERFQAARNGVVAEFVRRMHKLAERDALDPTEVNHKLLMDVWRRGEEIYSGAAANVCYWQACKQFKAEHPDDGEQDPPAEATAAPQTPPPPLPTFGPDLVPVEQSERRAAAMRAPEDELATIQKWLPALEAYVRSRLTDANLVNDNAYLVKHKERKITLRTVAAFLGLHRLNVIQRKGDSPKDRFIGLTAQPLPQVKDLFGGKIEPKHFTRLMAILVKDLNVTTITREPNHFKRECTSYALHLPAALDAYLDGVETVSPPPMLKIKTNVNDKEK
jgi:hypothetical protein